MNHLRLLLEISKVSVLSLIPFWIYYDYADVMKMTNLVSVEAISEYQTSYLHFPLEEYILHSGWELFIWLLTWLLSQEMFFMFTL